MRANLRCAMACWLLSAIAPCHVVLAQRAPDPRDRRDQLAKIAELLADPDPIQRLANLEATVRRGDPLETQFAVRTAFASDDVELQGLALRAFLATTGEVTFDITPPLSSTPDDAVGPARRQDPSRRERRSIERLERQSFKLQLTILNYEFPRASGATEAVPRRPAPFVVSGRQFTSRLQTSFGNCYVAFAPTPKPALDGTLACDGGWPKLPISASVL